MCGDSFSLTRRELVGDLSTISMDHQPHEEVSYAMNLEATQNRDTCGKRKMENLPLPFYHEMVSNMFGSLSPAEFARTPDFQDMASVLDYSCLRCTLR